MSHEQTPQTEVDPVAKGPAPIPSSTGEFKGQVSEHGIVLGQLATRVWVNGPQRLIVEKLESLTNPGEMREYVLSQV